MIESSLPNGFDSTKEPSPEAVSPPSQKFPRSLVALCVEHAEYIVDCSKQSPPPRSAYSLLDLYFYDLNHTEANLQNALQETTLLVLALEGRDFVCLEAEPDMECKLQILSEVQGVLNERLFQFGLDWGIDETVLKSKLLNLTVVEAEREPNHPLDPVSGTSSYTISEKGSVIRLSKQERQVMEKLSESEQNLVEKVGSVLGPIGITAKELMSKLCWSGDAKKATLFKILRKLKREDVGYILQDEYAGFYKLSISGKAVLEEV
jgi:hypothetical protein